MLQWDRAYYYKIVAEFRGMHVSPAKHSSASVTDGPTDRRTDRQTTDKVIPMCRYASQATQNGPSTHVIYLSVLFILITEYAEQGVLLVKRN